MFYSASAIDNLLKCEFCEINFTDVVKFVPNCGSIICGECYHALRDSLNEKSQFQCRVCDEFHEMPCSGFADAKALMKMLQIKSEPKGVSEEANKLRKSIDEIKQKIEKIKSFDITGAISSFCDQLQIEVMEMVDSAHEHVNKLSDILIKEIYDYRAELLFDSSTHAKDADDVISKKKPPYEEELNDISILADEMSHEWNMYFTQLNVVATDETVRDSQKKIYEYDARLTKLETNRMRNTFRGRFARFKRNCRFLQSTKLLGEVVYENSLKGNLAKDQHLWTLAGHTEGIRKTIFVANGNLVTGSIDKTIRIWDTSTGAIISEMKGHSDWILSFAVLHNGWLASGSRDKTIKLWDLQLKKPIRTLIGHTNAVFAIATLSNGNLASCSFDDTIIIWNPNSNDSNLLFKIPKHGITNFSIDLGTLPNGNFVTCSNQKDQENMISIWSPKDGSLVKSIPTGNKDARSLLVLSNQKIAVGFLNGLIKIFDPDTGDGSGIEIKINRCWIFSIVQLKNGYIISSGYNKEYFIDICSPEEARLIQSISTGHLKSIYSLSISADGKLLGSGSEDKTARVWSLIYD